MIILNYNQLCNQTLFFQIFNGGVLWKGRWLILWVEIIQFYHPKSYFIYYTILFYNIPNIPNFFFFPFYLIFFDYFSLSSSFSLFLKLTNNHNNATTMPPPRQNHATVQQHNNPLKKPPNKHNTTLPLTRQNHAIATNTLEPRHCHCHHHDTMNLLQPPPPSITHPYHHRNSPPSRISNIKKPTPYNQQGNPNLHHHQSPTTTTTSVTTLTTPCEGPFFGQYPSPSRNKDPTPFTCYLVDWAWFIAAKWGLITN